MLIFDPQDGGDTFVRNVGSCTDYTASAVRTANRTLTLIVFKWAFRIVVIVGKYSGVTPCLPHFTDVSEERYRHLQSTGVFVRERVWVNSDARFLGNVVLRHSTEESSLPKAWL
jgi:hypothetical protein